MTTESNSIAVKKDDDDVWGIAKWQKAIDTGLMPRSMTAAQAALIAAKGREMGMGPMRAINGLIVIHGRVTLTAEAMLGLIRERAFPMQMTIVECNNDRACLKIRRGFVFGNELHWEEWSEVQFTADDARQAGLWGKNNWKTYPQDMLWARCVSRLARRFFPEIIQGAITPEEAYSIPVETKPIPSRAVDFGTVLKDIEADRTKIPIEADGLSDLKADMLKTIKDTEALRTVLVEAESPGEGTELQ